MQNINNIDDNIIDDNIIDNDNDIIDNDIIKKWIDDLILIQKITENKLVSLPVETLINLIDLLSNEYGNNISNNTSNNIKKKINSKLISKKEKNILQIYEEKITNFFIKKQLNSNWTYLKYKNYQIRWNIIIYFYEKDTKSYEVEYKKKFKKKEIENNKPKILKFHDFFDKESDEEN